MYLTIEAERKLFWFPSQRNERVHFDPISFWRFFAVQKEMSIDIFQGMVNEMVRNVKKCKCISKDWMWIGVKWREKRISGEKVLKCVSLKMGIKNGMREKCVMWASKNCFSLFWYNISLSSFTLRFLILPFLHVCIYKRDVE